MSTPFRNLRVWRLDAPWTKSAEEIDEALQADAFQPCAPGQAESLGWEAPAQGAEIFARQLGDAILLRTRCQERVLPARAVAEAMAERLPELEDREGGPIRGALRRELADTVRAELLPHAPLQSTRNWILIDRSAGLILIDSATASTCESLLSLLRGSLGNLGVRPLAFARPIDGSLTTWLTSGDLPAGFELGRWADLEHPQDTGNKVRFRGQPLDEDEVTATLDRGLRVTALELLWHAGADEPLRFVLGEDGSFRRVRIPGELLEDQSDRETEQDRLDADLTLVHLSLGRLFRALFPALGGVATE